jgi:hypothetical protein
VHLRPSLAAATAATLTATVCAFALPASAQPHRSADDRDRGPSRLSVRVFKTHLPALATIGGVKVTGGAYGSSWTAKPGSEKLFYGLTDRGPNADGPDGTKVEPLPDFQPAIGEFRLTSNGRADLIHRIGLKAADGAPYNGQVNPDNSTSETITDLAGNLLPASPEGYDPEGLVAMKDGTFWVSDEYGPFITHFDRHGRALKRLTPTDGSLPRELVNREPNKGMEGLTVTPDGRTLVGIMQAALNAPDNTATKSKDISSLRIVTYDRVTGRTHEYLYLLHSETGPDSAVSEIAALNDHEFLVDERDGNVEPGADKKLFRIDLRGATDVGPRSQVRGATYDGTHGGLLVNGRSLEKISGKKLNTADTTAALHAVGITPVTSKLFLDVGALVTAIDPTGGYFGHDKVEGVAVLDRGRRVLLSNDNDFGIAGVSGDAAPFSLVEKVLPNGRQDDGEVLDVRMDRVPARYR